VELRLGIFQNREPLDAEPGVDGEPNAACEVGREGRGESTWDPGPGDFGGDFGDCTVTFGGDLLVGDLGGEKAIMDVGLGFGVLHGIRPTVPARGVTVPAPL
jgi:hypothetical protein